MRERIRAYRAKEGNEVGGSLHIILEDGNVDDVHVIFCFEHALSRGDLEGAYLASLIFGLSRTQRLRLID